MKRLTAMLALVASVFALTSCTAAEIQNWVAWHNEDPAAAEEFAARPEVVADLASGDHEQVAAASGRGGCDGIYDEFIRQGASSGVAQRFAYSIAPRESHCSAQFVHDGDDWSFSRLGLNGLTAGLRANWANWCGADVRSDTQVLSIDVRCALEAYERMGWAPWS